MFRRNVSQVKEMWGERNITATLGLIMLALYIINCNALDSQIYKRKFVTQGKGSNWNEIIKRFAENSMTTDKWNISKRASPYFDKTFERNATARRGDKAILHCIVHNLGDGTVVWIRRKDFHILTVGIHTYAVDQRFQLHHVGNDWCLIIRYVQVSDAGVYMCQVGVETNISASINLSVIAPKTEILGPQILYVQTGSSINVTCKIAQTPNSLHFLFWFHNDMIIYNLPKVNITQYEAGDNTTISNLYIKDVQLGDTGKYTCSPSNADNATIFIKVLNVEKIAPLIITSNSSFQEISLSLTSTEIVSEVSTEEPFPYPEPSSPSSSKISAGTTTVETITSEIPTPKSAGIGNSSLEKLTEACHLEQIKVEHEEVLRIMKEQHSLFVKEHELKLEYMTQQHNLNIKHMKQEHEQKMKRISSAISGMKC